MAETSASLLGKLSSLSRIDGVLSQIGAERKKLESSLKLKREELNQKEDEGVLRQTVLLERRHKQNREEKTLNEERQKLMDRRKAVSSFSGQKVQQAAEREITATSEMLNAQEEALIQGLTDIEVVEKDAKASEESIAKMRAEFQKFEEDTKQALITLEDRLQQKTARREELASSIDPSGLSAYNRVHERFPQNTVVPVKDKLCAGCYMTLVPQTIVQISRGESIIKCPGCGRILCLESHEKELE